MISRVLLKEGIEIDIAAVRRPGEIADRGSVRQFPQLLGSHIQEQKFLAVVRYAHNVSSIRRPTRAAQFLRTWQLRNVVALNIEYLNEGVFCWRSTVSKGQRLPIGRPSWIGLLSVLVCRYRRSSATIPGNKEQFPRLTWRNPGKGNLLPIW